MSKNTDTTDTAEGTTNTKTAASTDGKRYAAIPFSFNDLWAEDEDKREVAMNFRFAKPTKTQIKRLQDTASRNATQASRDMLLGTIHPDDKEALLAKMEDYPGIVTSYATALIKAVGISADVGN
ncbi:MAG: hypothetical protein DELT_02519 [Desulfovibrio sp.]